MKATLESLLLRVKKEVEKKAVISEKKKLEARREIARRGQPLTIYEKPEMWFGVAIHREYELQICDSCKGEHVAFNCDKVELRHRIDKSAIRWLRERGEDMDNLPTKIWITERVVPECFECHTLGKQLKHLFSLPMKGPENAQAPASSTEAVSPQKA